MNNKGFTLIELLATISILILIVSIAVPSIVSIKQRNEEKTKEKNKKLIEDSAEAYFEIYRGKITNKLDEEICLSLRRIVDDKLVKVPLDLDDDEINNKFVSIKKDVNDVIIYKYEGCVNENITFREWEE